MVLLDESAYRDIQASDLLSDRFARVRGKDADSSVAGRYSTLGIAGRDTLLELFGAPMPGPLRLTGGLVFTFARTGSALRARQLLAEEAGISSHYELVQRAPAEGGPRSPWYHLLSADLGADSPLVLFLNEVTPEYYTSLGARPGPDGELRRDGYLDAVFGGQPSPGQLVDNITDVTVRLRPGRVERIATVLDILGYDRDADGSAIVIHDAAIRVRLEPDGQAPEGITEVRMALTAATEASEHTFGSTARLVVGPGAEARWTFTPVDPADLP